MSIHDQLQEIFRQVFNDDNLNLKDETTASDISAWDSVTHINLMFSIEQVFGIRFPGNKLAELKNIGELKKFLTGKGCE